jgi:hypothetical protein
VLRRRDCRAALLHAAERCGRLVLLGDVLELRHGRLRDALAAAEPVLRELGAAVGPGGEIVVVPGNHDHHLLAGWLERCALAPTPPRLGLESGVEWRESEPLATIASWLEPASVRAAYPGVWLREDVYATHGHYCDVHTTVPMFERLAAGAMARIVREPSAGPRCAEDYEAILAPIYTWLHALAQRGGRGIGQGSHGASARAWRFLTRDGTGGWRRRAMIVAFPLAVAALNGAGFGPLRADLSGAELRRAGLCAFGEVLGRLGVGAAHVVFGHTHRAGPLGRDDRADWRAPTGAMMTNAGAWVHEPAALGDRPFESPYRAGFCVTVPEEGEPNLACLLDDITSPPAPAT